MNDSDGHEVALLETSNALDKADSRKVGSDHIKSMFGGLCMLADIADTYKFGSFENMSKVHVHIIRAHGKGADEIMATTKENSIIN